MTFDSPSLLDFGAFADDRLAADTLLALIQDPQAWASRSRLVASRAHLPLRSGVGGPARVPQWKLNPEDPHGANDLDSQGQRSEKGRGRWNGLHLRALVSVKAEWQSHEGKGLEPVRERHCEGRRHLPRTVLRFMRKELQQRQRENGERARAGIRKPALTGLTPE